MNGGGKSDKYANYMTIRALEDNLSARFTARTTGYQLWYCIHSIGEWVMLEDATYTPAIAKGDAISFAGDATTISGAVGTFEVSVKCNLEGNCMSLIHMHEASADMGNATFGYLFQSCTNIVEVSEDFLSATTLSTNAYLYMFDGCSSMVSSPKLPAEVSTSGCYYGMYRNCTSLIVAQKINLLSLATNACRRMFYGCSSMVKPPEMVATSVADSCCYQMFYGCSSMVESPKLYATEMASNCYSQMFYRCSMLSYIYSMNLQVGNSYTPSWVYGVASAGTFVKNKNATWTATGNSYAPKNWTIITE